MRRSLTLLFLLGTAGRLPAVVLSEIYYHPPAADFVGVELVEVHNPGAAPVLLGGWRIEGGARFTFPAGTSLAAGGYLAVARDAAAVAERFGAAAGPVLEGLEGFLDNDGEPLRLIDANGAIVEGVAFSDRLPWPESADGQGDSLQRLCATAEARDPLNWKGAPPTPGKAPQASQCPPPAFVPPRVVINELEYHPRVSSHPALEDGEDLESLELFNPGAVAVDLGGWSFLQGIELRIPAGIVLPPGGFLLLGRNPEKLRAAYPSATVLSTGYAGRLSNGGETIVLADSDGKPVDTVQYADSGEWPHAADGTGRSLERVSAAAPGYDPANWRTSTIEGIGFFQLSTEGGAGLVLSQTLVVFIDGPGEMIVDRILLEDITDAASSVVVLDETFDLGIEGWKAQGTAQGSSFAPGEGINGSGALRLLSSGACPNGDCGSVNSFSRPVPGVSRQGRYRLSVWARSIRGSPLFTAGLAKGVSVSVNDVSSPGKPNTTAASVLPPRLELLTRFPEQPRSSDSTLLSLKVRSAAPAVVTLRTVTITAGVQTPEGTYNLFDDGQHKDGAAGDGTFAVELPPVPHDSQVRFLITATAQGQRSELPIPLNAGGSTVSEWAGYYVEDLQPSSELPVYHLLVESLLGKSGIQDVNDLLKNCGTTVSASFAFRGTLYPDGEVRFRGNTACYPKKRNFKYTFREGLTFRGARKLNLNSEWTDKSMVREHLSWDFLRELGGPYCRSEFTRVHVNGDYFGLYLYVEHPDQRFLARNGLDDSGNLYKAKQPTSTPPGVFPFGVSRKANVDEYKKAWEAETNEEGDFTDLRDFIDAMHADGTKPGGPGNAFWEDHATVEHLYNYQLSQVLLNNIDSAAKNHFLYHDLSARRFSFFTWDLDLTFGKYFDPSAQDAAAGREVGTLNDNLLCNEDFSFDLNPWFGSTVNGNDLLNFLVEFFLRAGPGGYYQRAYLTRLWELLQERFRNETYNARLDDLGALLASEEDEDRARWGRFPSNVPGWPADMASNLEVVKEQLNCHRDFLLDYLRTLHPSIGTHARLKITEILYLPEDGDDDLELVEIQNVSESQVNLTGWQLQGVGGQGGAFQFPAVLVNPGEVFIVARSPERFRARYPELSTVQVLGPYDGKLADSGEALRILDAGPGAPATIDFVAYGARAPWPLVHPGHSIELLDVEPFRDNDLPESWQESAAPGGTPGRLGAPAPSFIRGDSTREGRIDLGDAVFTLSYLFRGGVTPSCLDAADVNDDGKVGLTDAVYLLQHLFQGGIAPPQPYPGEGPDPTGADELGCGG